MTDYELIKELVDERDRLQKENEELKKAIRLMMSVANE
jgi:predicted RNA-binding protein YlqC (UPF0109 family)